MPGNTRSRTGTRIEKSASDQRRPFVRKRLNEITVAPVATRIAKKILPSRESGVVFGSEIMKKAKRRSAPLWRRCSGIANGSPSAADLANRRSP
jgi:hypothetical protein